MLTDTDWIMHAKATRSMTFRSLRHGETAIAQRLFQAASQMETIAREAAGAPVAGMAKLTLVNNISSGSNRNVHPVSTVPEPHTGIQGEGGFGCRQG